MARGLKLTRQFYAQKDVVKIARALIGKKLVTNFEGQLTCGIITETEAYAGITDKASHSFGTKRTPRTEVMYGEPGRAYVYLCYGIHSLFNIITNKKETPHAVLIRSILPIHGNDLIYMRRKIIKPIDKICTGPGTVCQGLGIQIKHSGIDLEGDEIWLEESEFNPTNDQLLTRPRIGVDYAGEDALLPYRFTLKKEFLSTFLQ